MDTVRCPSCGEENPAKFRLCGFCGTSLAPAPETINCPSCGEENPGKFRLCGFCGTPLLAGGGPAPAAAPSPLAPVGAPAPTLPPTEVRKVVTLVFSDLKDSTALTASIDAEAMNEIKARYFASMAAEIERHGGSVEKNIGDAIMAVFGRIRAHEDDALRAVRAAYGMQRTLERLNEELVQVYGVTLKNRTGVNTGELVVNTDPAAVQNLATGEAVNVAARLEQNAPANETLMGAVTYELVRPWVEVERIELPLKGYAEPVPAYRLIEVRDHATERSEVADTPLVGRDTEMATLHFALADVTEHRASRLVTVVGDAGVGKSRLIRDFLTSVQATATVLRGRCLPYGDGITFWPLGEIARAASGIEQDDAPGAATFKLLALVESAPDGRAIVERLAAAIGLSQSRFPVAELFWAGRRFLEVLAAERPVAVLIDDIHSAEKTFLDFLDHVVDASRDAPILLVCSARHTLLEEAPDWGERPGMKRIRLEPLSDANAAELVGRLLGETGLTAAISDRVVAAADGNPLFVEQMVSMLIDKGMLRREGTHWLPVGDLAELAVPPSIQALLASRLDDLSREERAVVEPASVIGLTFFEPAVEEMVPDPIRPSVPTHLGELDRKQFVQPGGDEETFRFRHLLIRDATYGSLLKRNRAQLHERFVGWAERVNRERGREQEFEEILGYHLEQAYRYRTELGPIDAAGREIAHRAATKLGSAGRRAFARGDFPAATNLLRRATLLLEPNTVLRIELLLDYASVLLEDGEFAASAEAIEAADHEAAEIGDERLRRHASAYRGHHALLAAEGLYVSGDVLRESEATATWFEIHDDHAGAALTWRLIMGIHGTAGRYQEAASASRRVIEAARRAGDSRSATRGAVGYAISALHGPTPVPEALVECAQLMDQAVGDRKAEAVIAGIRALLHAMVGQFEDARRLSRDARRMVLDLGPTSVTANSMSTESARIELLAGDPAAAERELQRDVAALEALGERYFRSTVAGLLAKAQIALGAYDDAYRSAELTRELGDDDDTEAQILWRSAQACVGANRGDPEAERLAREAVDLAAGTVDLVLHADALVDLGEVLTAFGRREEAEAPFAEALGLYEQKGASVAAERVRKILAGDAVGA